MLEENTFEGKEEIAVQLQQFASGLTKLAGEQHAARQQIETRWLQDVRQYHGEYTATEKQLLIDAGGSQIFVNITRNKTNAAEARLQDMLFPTDDRNWGIQPTPVPDLSEVAAKTPGVDVKKIENEANRIAKEKAEKMQTLIDDQLKESGYSVKCRDIIHDAAQLGTGILKGPVIVGKSKKKWRSVDGVQMLEVSEALEPSTERVNPWDFFPDMSASCIDDAEFIFERKLMTKKQLREFSKLPGVLKGQISEVIRAGSGSDHIAKDRTNELREITGVDSIKDSNRYEIWEYHGPINKEDLINAVSCCGEQDQQDILPEEEIDELNDEIEAIVFFSGNSVLKVAINPMETEDRPYSVFNWEKDESSIFGFGVPYVMRNPQKVINAAMRMILDNAGASSSDVIVLNKEIVEPADGSWSSNPGKKKLYYLTDKTKSVRDAFAAHSIPNHQAELTAVFQMGRQLADEETSMPLIAQGEQSANVTKTSSGMAMLMNSANIVLRRAVKNWDDDITGKHITRYYDWNMAYHDDESVKGDYSIDARGSSALLVREKQQENLMIYANISAANPEFALRRDWVGMDKEIAKSLEVPHSKLTLPDEAIEQKQQQAAAAQQQGNPELELKQMEAQARAQNNQQDFQLGQQKLQMEDQIERERMAQERELKLVEIASKERITLEQLSTRTNIDLKRDKTTRDTAALTASSRQAEVSLKAQNLAQGHDTYG